MCNILDTVDPSSRWPVLADLLCHLVNQLVNIDPEAIGKTEQGLDEWSDEGYVYLEANLSRVIDLEADITVHDGKVMIRLEKN